MKIYTKTGDSGQTGLIGGLRISKTAARIAAIGDVDELNAYLGMALVATIDSPLNAMIIQTQHWLFDTGAELASPGEVRFATVDGDAIIRVENWIDELSQSLPELKSFILPGGSELAARLHVARSVSRRAERTVLVLHETEVIRDEIRIFLNRLADWLFVAARTANRFQNVQDMPWTRNN